MLRLLLKAWRRWCDLMAARGTAQDSQESKREPWGIRKAGLTPLTESQQVIGVAASQWKPSRVRSWVMVPMHQQNIEMIEAKTSYITSLDNNWVESSSCPCQKKGAKPAGMLGFAHHLLHDICPKAGPVRQDLWEPSHAKWVTSIWPLNASCWWWLMVNGGEGLNLVVNGLRGFK